jgi:hypothetical protein
MRAFLVLWAVLAAPACASSVSASSTAYAWLRDHAGTPNELAELKDANPEAFAIVQALLTKRSLGLLNNKHPSASFSNPAPVAQEAAEPAAGAEAEPQAAEPHALYAESATPSHVQLAEPAASAEAEAPLPYANVKATHHDWLNWKPHSSGADEAMVSNVLGMVGGMKASAAVEQPETSAPVGAPTGSAEIEPAAPAVEEAAPKATSDWGSIGGMLGLHKKPHHKAAPAVAAENAMPPSTLNVEYASASQPQVTTKGNDWNSAEKLSADKDDKAVSSLLNMVAQLKGKKAAKLLKKHHVASSEDSALSNDLAEWGDVPEDKGAAEAASPVVAPAVLAAPSAIVDPFATPPVAAQAVVAPAAPEPQSSWGSIGGMLGMRQHMAAAYMAAPASTASVSASSSAYGLNWRPKAAGEDEAMVANVLGMVGANGASAASVAPVEVAPAADAVHDEVPHGDKDEKAVNSLLNMVAQLKGGRAAEKLLSKHQHAASEETSVSDSAMASSEPAAPQMGESWGSIGGMLGIRRKPKPAPRQEAFADETAMPEAVQTLVSGVSEPVHHTPPQMRGSGSDNWKSQMQKKEDSDDSAVKSLLSMVAKLKGSSKAERLAEEYEHTGTEESSLSRDALENTDAPTDGVPAQNQVAPVSAVEEAYDVPATPARKKNGFLNDLTSSLGTPEPTPEEPAPVHENAYLKMFDLSDDSSKPKHTHKAAFASSSTRNYLSSFSWNDAPEQSAARSPDALRAKHPKLLSWLSDGGQPEPTEAPIAAKPPTNPYLADLMD